ncbi:transaldolase [Flaviflexus equikiangi]|uniref:Transaldolase n=1 Tax=Flaviflexus equikiangi TaxID=2758573 RepID=A0ABS2TIB4_9ACTO|nr:transaldolase [Flaviflexus equikiangi]MBM9434103.1 transaldolase [Flaviflexus equikiangi]
MTNLQKLSDAGVSIWLDDLSRSRLTSGNLQSLIDNKNVVGVTTNPSIFQAAISAGEGYEDQLAAFAGRSAEEAVEAMTTDDVRAACDLFAELYSATGGEDGRVSIEVDPRLARDTEKTVEQAKRLWEIVDRPNALIKIPATPEGLPAITQVVAAGISVNVTLIFSLDRYRAVAEAYIDGLERAADAGIDLSTITSVASVFISRIDAEVDARLATIGGEALDLQGQVALANARLMFEAYEEIFSSPRFQHLAEQGAHRQRPLWASTGTKNPDYSPTLYVDGLVTDGVVNTMPEATLDAAFEGSVITGDTVRGTYDEARTVLASLARVGVNLGDVTNQLEEEGVSKFEESWNSLLATVKDKLDK